MSSSTPSVPQTVEEKIQHAQQLKEQGNEHFKKGETKKAIRSYKHIFLYVTGLGNNPLEVLSNQQTSMSSSSNKDASPIAQLQLTANLNLAACYLKISPPNYRRAKEYADKVLKSDSENVKAIFRRAQASLGLQDIDNARIDLEKAQKLAPEDALIKKELKRLEQMEVQHKQKEKKLYQHMFKKMDESNNQQ
jgi:tetratricopeptide (TPR) repeat protein